MGLRHTLARLFFGEVPLAVAQSLRRDPTAWSTGLKMPSGNGWFEIVHRNGIRLWIANRGYGMEVSRQSHTVWGGVSSLSSVGLSPGHHLLRAAANRWLNTYAPPTEAEDHRFALLEALK